MFWNNSQSKNYSLKDLNVEKIEVGYDRSLDPYQSNQKNKSVIRKKCMPFDSREVGKTSIRQSSPE